LSVPILNDRSTAKRRATTANDRLFMVNSVSVEKNDEFPERPAESSSGKIGRAPVR
jgi:hypothetical protein